MLKVSLLGRPPFCALRTFLVKSMLLNDLGIRYATQAIQDSATNSTAYRNERCQFPVRLSVSREEASAYFNEQKLASKGWRGV